MKRILTILLVVMMVFSMTGCDPEARGNLANMMGAMGHNVLGTDTASVDKLVDMVGVNKDKIQKPVVGGPAVNVSENISIKSEEVDGKVFTKINVGGNEVTVEGKVSSVLPPMEDAKKDELVEEIGKNIKSDEKKADFVNKMSVAEKDPEIVEATAGSAVIMKSAIEQVVDKIPLPDESNPEQRKQIEELKKSISGLTENLEKIGSKTTEVSKADVVTIQLVQNFVETVSVAKIEPGNVPTEVLTDASNLLTVTTALSEASKFKPVTVVDALVAGINGEKEKEKGFRTVRGVTEGSKETPIEMKPEDQQYPNILYKAVVDVLQNEDFAATKSGLGFHSQSYENYVNMLATKVDLQFQVDEAKKTAKGVYVDRENYLYTDEFDKFNTFEGVLQYAVAAALTEADDLYAEIKTLLAEGVTVSVQKRDAEGKVDTSGEYEDRFFKVDNVAEFAPNIRELIFEFVKLNPWIEAPTSKTEIFKIPDKYAFMRNDADMEALGRIIMATFTGRDFDKLGTLNVGKRQYGRFAFETMNKAIVFTGLGDLAKSLGDVDVHYEMLDMIKHLYIEQYAYPEPEKNPANPETAK